MSKIFSPWANRFNPQSVTVQHMMLDARCSILDARSSMLDLRCW
ncbi:MAG: hypothetical protein AB1797_07455 [bacterium]